MPLCLYAMRMPLMQFHKWINKLLLVMKSWKQKTISFNASIALQRGVNRHPKSKFETERERERRQKTKAILIFINAIRETFELLIIVSIGFISRNSTIIPTGKKISIHSFIQVLFWLKRDAFLWLLHIIGCCTKTFLIKSLKISSWMKNCLQMERSNRNK